jgi:uncharacterized membrane protein YphA (DoxX/SURF4 family)
MKIVRIISRILIGLVFVFSGFVKAVDPWGTNIKFEEYFEALGMHLLIPYAFEIAVLLIVAEFIVGFCLLFGLKMKLTSWGLLLFMLIFFPLTLWLAISNKVTDCGCFGDFIKLSNWGTFYKNVIIMIPTLIIFFQRNKYKSIFGCGKQWLFSGIGILIVGFIIWHSYAHLPLIDFLPYKVGTDLKSQMTVPEGYPKDVYEQFIKLKDTTSGNEIEVTVTAYTNDSTYWGTGTKYKYLSISEAKLVKEGYKPPIHDFTINNENGKNILDSVLNFDEYAFIFVSKKVEKANIDNIKKVNELAKYAASKNYIFLGLTASLKEQINAFIVATQAPYLFYTCDETTLKTAIRANPGIILLKKGVVVAKWHYNDIPTVEEFKNEFKIN